VDPTNDSHRQSTPVQSAPYFDSHSASLEHSMGVQRSGQAMQSIGDVQ